MRRSPVYTSGRTCTRTFRGWDDFQPWLDRLVNFPEEVVDDALARLPKQWLNGDAKACTLSSRSSWRVGVAYRT
jgi:hypothetical protein